MHGRNSELNQTNYDLVNLLRSMQMPIVMLNGDLRIRRYTPSRENPQTDIGRPISDLKSRIDVPDLDDLLRQVKCSPFTPTSLIHHLAKDSLLLP